MLELADATVANQFAGEAEGARGALLGAELKDALVVVDFLPQCPILGQVQAHRFFQVNILAGAHGGQRGQDVPMVGCGDQHGIDVFAGEQLAEVAIRSAVLVLIMLVDAVARLLEVAGHDIAHGDNLGVLLIEEVAHVPLSLRADTDAADGNAVAGGDAARFAQGRSGYEGRKRRGGERQPGGLLQELPSRGVGVVHNEMNGQVNVCNPLAAGTPTPRSQHDTDGGAQKVQNERSPPPRFLLSMPGPVLL